MCDTQVILTQDGCWLAKNSDREASEAQYVVRLPAVHGDASRELRTTYITVDQVPDRYAVIISKPFWIWGAEMGVNDQGVAIGNEAVFTRLVDRKGSALLGMDLLRLALERAATARQALEVITGLLSQYGQGGPAGFRDKRFRYDNSFIIADHGEAWILETAGRHWVARHVLRPAGTLTPLYAAISNSLSIGSDYDLCSDGLEEFAQREGYWNGEGEFSFCEAFDTWFYPFFGGARHRRELSLRRLSCMKPSQVSLAALIASLRSHRRDDDHFARHDNRDVCLHAGGLARPSQTTASMVAQLGTQGQQFLFTGSSAACLSLFKPASMHPEQSHHYLSEEHTPLAQSFWQRQESVHRRLLFSTALRRQYREALDAMQARVLSCLDRGDAGIAEAEQLAAEFFHHWQEQALQQPLRPPMMSLYGQYWRRMNRLDDIN